MRNRILIIGGGVCGLGVGWKLAKAGKRVVLFEKSALRQGATWVAAGMLAPQMELSEEEETVLRLGRESLRRWPNYRDELEADAGMSVDYRDDGTLFAAFGRDDALQLRELYEDQIRTGLEVEWMSGSKTREMEPRLSRRASAGIYSAVEHQVDAAAVGDALIRAFQKCGGEIRENTPVESVLIRDGRAVGVQLEDEIKEGSAVVVAAGAWTGLLGELGTLSPAPVRPMKGQIFTVQQSNDPLIRRVVWALYDGEFIYLAPKSDGRLLVGATVEERGFDTLPTIGAAVKLLRPACKMLPDLSELPMLKWSVGLRPGSRDNAPILGKTAVERLFMATGHYRNGILFAPVTAEEVSAAILTGETSGTIAPYSLERFQK